ncbi:hypothetical protein JG688_00009497 [Phytophthora aleatoria]|uniref:Ricin B lectin domain-containing protein n=1 Tax=Phytophthora aleatoria TaxID=2496075 RepID=A0A8J5M3Z6_9STRA|nr:hypothetical protein JG688_00009497 [Phytophthora aleatoria]
MTLENARSTDESALLSGQEVLLRVSGKPNLCADDGGSLKPDESAFTGQPCNLSNPNQLFIYNSKTHQFHSAKKKGLCLDDGGGWVGLAWHFEVLSQATLAAEQQKVLDAVSNGAKFLLRIAGKTGMCAAGPRASIAATSLVLAACDKRNKNQIFTYDPLTKRLRSAEKLSYCLDDGGVRNTDARLASCDSSSLDQSFVYDRATLQFTQPNKAGMCLDDGSGVWFTAPKLMLRKCDAYSANQHFENSFQHSPSDHDGNDWNLGNCDRASEKARLIPEESHNGASIVTEAEPGLVPEEGHSELTTRGEHGLVSEEENNVASGESERFPEETQHGALVDIPDENFVPASKHNYVTTTDEPELIPEESHNGESMAIQAKSGFFPEEGLLKSAGEPEFFLEATMDQKSDVESAANAVPAITAVDTSFERFVDQDWNLLATSDKTIRRVNADQSSSISADIIFQFLQSIKDRADLEHELMMYRCKRTFGCVSAGLQTLATDSVMTDEYDVLVRWMYEHCAAGSTEIALSLLPPLPKRDVNSGGVAPLVDDSPTDVTRHYMTKMDFYYQIKNHFTQTIEKLDGDVAGTHLRSEEKNEQQKKTVDCIEKAVARFGYRENAATETTPQLKTAISWVDSCIKS